MVRKAFVAALLLVLATASLAWTPRRSAVSPAVDAWSHSEACQQYCVSWAGTSCASGTVDSFIWGGAESANGGLKCTVNFNNGNPSAVRDAASVDCGAGSSRITSDGNSCSCPANTYFDGTNCSLVCPSGGRYFSGYGCLTTIADPGKSVGPPDCPRCRGIANPIDASFGHKYQEETDYVGTGVYPLVIKRHYNSRGLLAYDKLRLPASFSSYWTGNYSRELAFAGGGSVPTAVSAARSDGRVLLFRQAGAAYQPDLDVADTLSALTDGSGAIIGWLYYIAASEETETYNAAGQLLSIANRANLSITFTYDALGLLTHATDPFGRQLVFGYDDRRRVTSITAPGNSIYSFAYDTQDRLTSVTYPDTKTRVYHYESASFPRALTGITDENQQRFATWGYDSEGRANLSEHAGGADHTTLTYIDTASTTVTDARSQTRTLGFEMKQSRGRHTATTGVPCSDCGFPAHTLDANANVATRGDWNGNRANYTYDLTRNLETSRTEALTSGGATTPQTRTISTQWHANFRLATAIAEPLRITTNVYDADGTTCGARGALCSRTVQATTDANGSQGFSATASGTPRTWTYTYNANGSVLTLDGPRTDASDVTTYTYHPNSDPDVGKRGNVATITNAAGHLTSITAYSEHGQPLTIVDPNGLTTTLTYDSRQRLKTRTAGSELTSYDYDDVGQLTKVTLPDGSFLSYSYDAAHRLTGIQDNIGNRIAYTLDAMGNRTLEQVFDPVNTLAQTRSRVYSSLNRLFQELGAQSQTTEYGYDDQGNVTSVKDALNRTTANQYDALNRLKQVTDPATPVAGVTQYAYNGLDALTSVTDPRSLVTGYTVDGLGNLTQQASPDTGTTINTHDAAGNLLTQTDAKGQLTSYAYDVLNRVTLITFHDGSKQAYAYDQGTNGIGRLSSITETNAADQQTSLIQYTYEAHGRVASETRTVNGVPYALGYGYDTAGRLASLTYPSGRTLTYSFDSLGRVSAISTTYNSQTQQVVSAVDYHPFGGVKSYTLGNGRAYTRNYDQDGRISSYTLAGSSFAIGYDAASRIEFISETANPPNSNTYGYDNLDRLTSAATPGTPYGYTYDGVGNRLTKTVGAGTETLTYSPSSNRVATLTPASGPPRSFVFDPNGSTTNDGVNTFTYDVRGRMVQSTSAVGTTDYQVNALGQRIRKSSALGDSVFHYDSQGRLVAETGPSGTLKRELIYLGDIPVGVIQ